MSPTASKMKIQIFFFFVATFSCSTNALVSDDHCEVSGICVGEKISTLKAESYLHCLRHCKEESDCKWVSFFTPGRACFLYQECQEIEANDEFCISAERQCYNNTYSKALVALGHNIADVEIVDLLSSETICQKPENFPYVNRFESGGLGFQEKPLICGGLYNNSWFCHLYEDGDWKSSESLKQGRNTFSMTKSPFQDGSSKLFLTGGISGSSPNIFLSSSELLTENGWQVSVPLPVTIYHHCMVTVNSTSVMVIGGNQNNRTVGKSFLLNSETNIWTEGPTLAKARYRHSCAAIRKNNQTQDKSLIAVGGYDGTSFLSSVEILDLDTNAWRRGPDLPLAITLAAIVEDPSGGVVLIGGFNDGIGYLDTVYRLPHAGSDATWELMTQKLKTKRWGHTAFLIPDEIVACF